MADKKTITLTKGLIKLPDGTYIAPYTDAKGALDICDIGQALYINEAEGLRRRLNGQTVSINDHTMPFLRKLQSIQALYPKLFVTEGQWQSIFTNSEKGQCGKFVIHDNGLPIYDLVLNDTPTITDEGIIPANHSYISKKIPFSKSNNIEIMLKINIDSLNGVDTILCNPSDMPDTGGIVIRTDNGTRLYLWGTTNNVSWTSGKIDTGIDISEGTQYIKIVYDGNVCTLHSSYDKEIWTEGTPIITNKLSDCFLHLGGFNTTRAHILNGTYDLSETYVKVDNNDYWKGIIHEPEYIRIPAIVNLQGLQDLEYLGNIVESGLPNHTHSGTTSSNGAHTHTTTSNGAHTHSRGTMNIKGTFAGNTDDGTTHFSGPFYIHSTASSGANGGNGQGVIGFDASKNWTGATSSNGAHTHTAESNGAHTHTMTTGGASDAHYGKANTVQEEAIQYPYFIQIATGQYTTSSIRNDLKINSPYTIFEPKYSYSPLNNASWLLSNLQDNEKSVYPYAYEALCVELNNTIQSGTEVDLPSGGKYIKHLQKLVYDSSRFAIIGNPNITPNGLLTNSNSSNYVKLNIGNAFERSDSYSLKFLMQFKNNTTLLSTHNQDTINNSNGWLIRLYNNKMNISLAISEGVWAHEMEPSSIDFIENEWYIVKLSYNNGTGYKIEISIDENNYETIWSSNTVDRFIPTSTEFYFGYDYANTSINGTVIDLKTIVFNYYNEGSFNITGAYYVPMVINKKDYDGSKKENEYKFVVDTVTETFRLPTKIDRELNNGEMLYFFIGDTLQNTSLINIGRMSEALARKVDTDRFNRDYFSYKCPVFTLEKDKSANFNFNMLCKGRPIFINISGDMNITTETGWSRIYLYKNDVQIANQIVVSPAVASSNAVFSLNYLDTQVAYGETINYKVTITQHNGTAIYGEDGTLQTPNITAFEI